MFKDLLKTAAEELSYTLEGIQDDASEKLCDEILAAKRILLYGTGREGLMVKAFAMRLFHLGLDAHMVHDMTTPAVAEGDLFIVSAGPGGSTTVLALLGAAKEVGAKTLAVSAEPQGAAAQQADVFVHVSAQTMASDQGGKTSALPMGSLFEIVELIFFDLVVVALRERMGQRAEDMRARHTNLE